MKHPFKTDSISALDLIAIGILILIIDFLLIMTVNFKPTSYGIPIYLIVFGITHGLILKYSKQAKGHE